MQLSKSFMFTLFCFAAISSANAIIPIRRLHSSRRHNTAFEMGMSEKHYHNLLQIANKDAVSILDTDFMNYRPPYIKDFCSEIDALVKDSEEYQSEEVLVAIAEKFKGSVYTEVNFPYTHNSDAQVKVDNDELLKYRRKNCNYHTKKEKRESNVAATYFAIIIILVIVLFHKM